ncbi:AlpA family transcriptional regulator [Labrenzia sp. PHM005]|uniref:helix-turn-helix transcriptional regulator n=1 Tax=Labrenzia sp. PHM005 TaxID=2590016 RepID=UPI0011401735|nr:helix-turn-helix domain-containing protein [Labrenzia sp. PHM005]
MEETNLSQFDTQHPASVEQAILVLLQHLSGVKTQPRNTSRSKTGSSQARQSRATRSRKKRLASSASSTLLTPAQAAKRLNLSPKTLANYRSLGIGPKFVRLSGRAIRYCPRDLHDYVKCRRFDNTSAADSLIRSQGENARRTGQ